MHHQLTKSFESEGYNVLFIENTGVRSLKINDLGVYFQDYLISLNILEVYKKNSNLINILSPIILPFHSKHCNIF